MRLVLSRLHLWIILVASILAAGSLSEAAAAQSPAAAPKVQAVLFYRSSCSHCVQLVVEVLPPILQKFGDSLQIFYCDVSGPAGDALFTAAIDRFKIKTIGVPTLVVGQDVLIGSVNIQEQFPGLIEAGLSSGGLGWPDIPGLQAAFATAGLMTLPALGSSGPSDLLPVPGATATSPSASLPAVPASKSSPLEQMRQNFLQDVPGNILAVVVLAGMVAALVVGLFILFVRPYHLQLRLLSWLIPVLCLAGLGISIYLAYVEISQANALCGPVGRCEVVQASRYSRLFGVLPVGLVGAAGYIAMGVGWVVARLGRGRWARLAALALFGLAALGLLFSIYLTFLEPFVIGASCLWCLASAVIMTCLFGLTLRPGKDAWAYFWGKAVLPPVF